MGFLSSVLATKRNPADYASALRDHVSLFLAEIAYCAALSSFGRWRDEDADMQTDRRTEIYLSGWQQTSRVNQSRRLHISLRRCTVLIRWSIAPVLPDDEIVWSLIVCAWTMLVCMQVCQIQHGPAMHRLWTNVATFALGLLGIHWAGKML